MPLSLLFLHLYQNRFKTPKKLFNTLNEAAYDEDIISIEFDYVFQDSCFH